MKLRPGRTIAAAALLLLVALPVQAQEADHSVWFDDFGFAFSEELGSSVNITSVIGDDPDVGPLAPSAPSTLFSLYGPARTARAGGQLGDVRLFRVADLGGYAIQSAQLEELAALLADRPDLAAGADGSPESIPLLVDEGAAQGIRFLPTYLDTDELSGIVFVTAFVQDTFPFSADSFTAVFEGITAVGEEMICGIGRVAGLYAGFVINRQGLVGDPEHPGRRRPAGILYRGGIAKISAFSRACNDDGIPLIWLQDISGFDIGHQAEVHGLLAYGSSLIYTNSTNSTPMFTVLLRKASGAGYYAMSGLPYDPVVQLSTSLSRLSVMEGRTLAIAAFNTKLDDDFNIMTTDPAERAKIAAGMKETEARIEGDMDPFVAARQLDTDEIVEIAELRAYLAALVEMAYQGVGYRRVKNPRIWSMHDLRELVGGAR